MVAAVASHSVLATAARVAPAPPRRAAGGGVGVAPSRRRHRRQGHNQQRHAPQLQLQQRQRRDEHSIVVARAEFAEIDAGFARIEAEAAQKALAILMCEQKVLQEQLEQG